MTRLYHQLGHRFQWSLASIRTDDTGEGVIVGPRYMAPAKVCDIPTSLRRNSLFDPQFFLPNSARGKLPEYSFFPHVLSGGFTTGEWTSEMARSCAESCLAFQSSHQFSAIVIPTRFYEGMPGNFVSSQEEQFVVPFLQSIEHSGLTGGPVYLQLILTDQMVKDEEYRADILNWITSYTELDGIYLIYHVHNRQKQITDIDFLIGILQFVGALKHAGLSVVVGYTNTESVLLLSVGPDALTVGSYENLRMFNLRSFEEPAESRMRGPTPRVYVPRLLQWIEYQYVGAIGRVVNDLGDYLEDNEYRVRMFEPTYNWHFTKPEPYRHYFSSFARQFRRLGSSSPAAAVDVILAECQHAAREYEALNEAGLVFPPDSSGAHLASWITALNLWRGGR